MPKKKIKWLQLKKYFTIKVKVKINLEGAKTLQNISLLCNLGTLTIIRKKIHWNSHGEEQFNISMLQGTTKVKRTKRKRVNMDQIPRYK